MEAVGLLVGGLFCIGIPMAGLIIGVKIGLKRRRHGPGLREQAAVSSQFINSNVEIRTAAPGPKVIDELQRAVPVAIGNWDRVLVTPLSVSPLGIVYVGRTRSGTEKWRVQIDVADESPTVIRAYPTAADGRSATVLVGYTALQTSETVYGAESGLAVLDALRAVVRRLDPAAAIHG